PNFKNILKWNENKNRTTPSNSQIGAVVFLFKLYLIIMFTSFYHPIYQNYTLGLHCKKYIVSIDSAVYRQAEIDRDISSCSLFIQNAHIVLTLRSLMARKPTLSF
ncbi:MAG: hypothetical protein NWP47_01440, partial [Rickettsiaceae bacterium]|nr:hypothetical protein [Rickettsiaceae bacterium]